MKYWRGSSITSLKPNQVFVFGSNPEGRHGAGAAKVAMRFGAKYGIGRGLQGQTYALITKNLKPYSKCRVSGFTYVDAGERSLTLDQIRYNVKELYDVAKTRPELEFLVAYTHSVHPSLCGYDTETLIRECFLMGMDKPSNIILHESFRDDVETLT